MSQGEELMASLQVFESSHARIAIPTRAHIDAITLIPRPDPAP